MTAPALERPSAAVPGPLPVSASASVSAPVSVPEENAGGSGSEPVPAGSRWRPLPAVARAVTLAAVLLLGFAGYLFALSGLQEARHQSTAYATLRDRLANATAPTGSTEDGAPLAVLDVPALGLRQAVVVEGTTGRDLMRGPGHRRDTVLPGQPGVAVLFGRSTAFGAPFADLGRLRVGDRIDVTTGQGSFHYTVNAHGDGGHPIQDTAPNRLVLVTGDSDWIPTSTVLVGARLDGDPEPAGAKRPTGTAADKALAADKGALSALQLWSLAMLLAVVTAVVAARRWRRAAAYLCFAPVVAALLWSVYENAAALLPNVY
ncbi:sortase A [Kitasatospora sp. SolWspMP-SS2h]|uniref:sortase n=1 Tax=Kitasatospora sp. SolWspMP-SS2h TaxID=1305729 RepID=UPI000DC029BF|nr:sortase [Kitasatospora sp. SolWspMP-SS2h]RAJ44807.1 sortase A [Kitasatospora sp. SolWspMP-SS2h]